MYAFLVSPMHAACSTILVNSNFMTFITMGYYVNNYVPTECYHYISFFPYEQILTFLIFF